jgi:hypothetical protein
MLSRFDARQRRAIVVLGSLWLTSIVFVMLAAVLGGPSP